MSITHREAGFGHADDDNEPSCESKGHTNPEKYGIIYEPLQEKYLEQAIECLVETFSKGEPMTKALGITPAEFRHLAGIFAEKAVKDGLSTVAMDRATGRIVGVCVSEDLMSEPPEGMDKIHAKFYPIMSLLSELDEGYTKSRPHEIGKGEVFHLFMAGVRESYRGQSIATTLIYENLNLAKLKGFSYAIAEATGPVSQHILRDKSGFAEKFAVEYESFAYEGEHVFENMETPSACILVEKRLY